MNKKKTFDIDKCFRNYTNPIRLFDEWFNKAKKAEINDPNALALATSDKNSNPSVRIVLLKGFSDKGFIF